MKLSKLRLLSAIAGVTACVWITAQAADVPKSVAEKVVEGDITYLQKSLEKTPEKRAVPTIKASAIMLAATAQNAKGDKMMAVRDQALKVAEAIAKKDLALAKTEAGKFASAKAGNDKEIDLSKQAKIDLAEVMSVFRKGTAGGRNIEADLKAQVKTVTDTNLAAQIGAHCAVIADLTAKHPPGTTTGDKLKQWNEFCKEMKTISTDLADEAGKSAADKKKVGDLLKKLEKNCTDCHNKFRD